MWYIGVLIVLSISGMFWTSVVAQDAVPGDSLYAFKLNVNEKVADMLSISSQDEAEFQLELAEERLNEKIKLASQNKLDVSISASLDNKIDTHLQNYLALESTIKAEENIDENQSEENVEENTEVKADLIEMKDQYNAIIAANNSINVNTNLDVNIGSNNEENTSETENSTQLNSSGFLKTPTLDLNSNVDAVIESSVNGTTNLTENVIEGMNELDIDAKIMNSTNTNSELSGESNIDTEVKSKTESNLIIE